MEEALMNQHIFSDYGDNNPTKSTNDRCIVALCRDPALILAEVALV